MFGSRDQILVHVNFEKKKRPKNKPTNAYNIPKKTKPHLRHTGVYNNPKNWTERRKTELLDRR